MRTTIPPAINHVSAQATFFLINKQGFTKGAAQLSTLSFQRLILENKYSIFDQTAGLEARIRLPGKVLAAVPLAMCMRQLSMVADELLVSLAYMALNTSRECQRG